MRLTPQDLLKDAGRTQQSVMGWVCALISAVFALLFLWLLYLVVWRNPTEYGVHDIAKASTLAILAAHPRSFQRGRFTTLDEHRPKAHQRYLEWTPSRIIEWAGKIGPQCALVVEEVMASRPHPEQGFRSCLGIIRLAKAHGDVRLEAACRRALHFGTVSYRSIESILDKRLESQPLQGDLGWSSPDHENVRGQTYFA